MQGINLYGQGGGGGGVVTPEGGPVALPFRFEPLNYRLSSSTTHLATPTPPLNPHPPTPQPPPPETVCIFDLTR